MITFRHSKARYSKARHSKARSVMTTQRQKTPAAKAQHGIALIAVLLLLVFVLTLVGGMFYRHQVHIQKVTRSLVGEQALLVLLSAESWAKSVLVDDGQKSSTDHLEENWAKVLPLLPVEGGVLSGCLVDLQSRINLNNLSTYTNKSWDSEVKKDLFDNLATPKSSHRTVVRQLLQFVELDDGDARIAALADWVDSDSWLLSPHSAEDNEYLLLDPAYRAANHGLVDLSELSLVQSFSHVDVAALKPYVNTLLAKTVVNVNTAGPVVMVALLPNLRADMFEEWALNRPFDNLEAFYTATAITLGEESQGLKNQLPAELIGVSSQYFALNAQIALAGVHMSYTSVIFRQSDQHAQVLQRTLRYIPPVTEERGNSLVVNTVCAQTQEAPTSL